MVFLKALEMSKTKIMRRSADEIAMIMRWERMTETGAYGKSKSTLTGEGGSVLLNGTVGEEIFFL